MTANQPINLADLIAQGTVTAPPDTLDTASKDQLAQSGQAFTITGLTTGNDPDYGPYVAIDAQLDTKVLTFRLPVYAGHEAFYQSLATAVGQQPVSGVRLRGAGSVQLEGGYTLGAVGNG